MLTNIPFNVEKEQNKLNVEAERVWLGCLSLQSHPHSHQQPAHNMLDHLDAWHHCVVRLSHWQPAILLLKVLL